MFDFTSFSTVLTVRDSVAAPLGLAAIVDLHVHHTYTQKLTVFIFVRQQCRGNCFADRVCWRSRCAQIAARVTG